MMMLVRPFICDAHKQTIPGLFKYWSLINNQHFTSTAPTKSYVCGQTQLLELWDLLASVSPSLLPPPPSFVLFALIPTLL